MINYFLNFHILIIKLLIDIRSYCWIRYDNLFHVINSKVKTSDVFNKIMFDKKINGTEIAQNSRIYVFEDFDANILFANPTKDNHELTGSIEICYFLFLNSFS